jgi:hypothetical protein
VCLLQVYGDEEWSFGYCENGTGVFSCPPCKNPMYTYRESIVLGKTTCSIFTVNQILRELSWKWPGGSYELLSRNCNHFCNTFCEKLDVPKLPGPSNCLLIHYHINHMYSYLTVIVLQHTMTTKFQSIMYSLGQSLRKCWGCCSRGS